MTEQLNEPKDNQPSPVLVVMLIVPLLGILVALVMIASNPNGANTLLPTDMNLSQASLIHYTAPAFDVLDTNGKIFSSLDYKGRVIFLNFWQTTCEPCKREMPDFAQFSKEQGASGVAVITISFGETTDAVKNFLATYNVIGLKVGVDPDNNLQRVYGVANIPTTFIIDQNGIVQQMKLGSMTLDEMYQYAESMGVTRPT